ncbi:MAG: phosphotransacetylase family protein [Theionarchaea archaeon]|nr:phosphotransacetylase family protein [Theionarchaea archaeon]MBU7000136.1 phosphotransacetylase family protein [Theionarchaea archaeon]MBU7020853.1 phosphotransacetylase family protein [Theionarchaea archaeon]MBU7033911.1 phosphotransacetylase family protein [Theionarchaea archaeon]MBU7039207.1 phosphotransacetylase family protein [Theionarchaea archaeon]
MSLLITSTSKNAGKTMVGLGIGLNCPGKVGFFKPLGTNLDNGNDRDVLLFREVFGLTEDAGSFNLSKDYHRIMHDLEPETDFTHLLMERYQQLSRGKDFTIIETAHTLSYGSYTGLSAPQIGSQLGVPAVLVTEGTSEKIIDKSVMADRCFAVKEAIMLGVVVNKASSLDENLQAQLEEKGITLLGVIPEDEDLKTPTSEDVLDVLDGELLAGEEGLHKMVGTTVVGAMTYDTAQRTLQQMGFPQKTIMVTGGDRADMQLLACDSGSSLLVLTGSSYPSMDVLAKADELHIPVVMVPYDTMTAAQRCEQTVAELRPHRAPLVKELVKRHVDLKQIFDKAG